MQVHDLVRSCTPRLVRNWIRRPIRSGRYVGNHLAFACGSVVTMMLREGWSARCHPASREHFEVFLTDPFQRAELDSVIRHCRPFMRLWDIGAHHGLFALAALHYGGAGAKVVCVEPSRAAAGVLAANLGLNGCAHSARIIVAAMGGEDGELQMLTTGPFAGDYLIAPADTRADATVVPQRRLATVVQETGLVPTHIKLDIEGFEFEVIAAARELLAELRPVLFLEIHGDLLRARGKDPEELMRILRAAGYQRFTCGQEVLSDDDLRRLAFNLRVVCT